MTELLNTLPANFRQIVGEEFARLETSNKTLEASNKTLESKCRALVLENKLLNEKLRLQRIQKYGPKSEQLTDAQLELLETEPGVSAMEVEKEAACTPEEKAGAEKVRSRHPGRTEFDEHLPRVHETILCTPEQCKCSRCGQEKKAMGFDTNQELHIVPAKYYVRVISREKRVCMHCPDLGVATAPQEAKIVEKAKASNEVVVDVLIKKYAEHLPLYRQCATLERDYNIQLSRMTLCGWVIKSGEWLQAISRAMRAELLAGSYIQADETPIGVQSEKTKGRNHLGFFWEYSSPGGTVIFDFRMDRTRAGPKAFLENFGGRLQCDGYPGYDKIGGPGMILAGCWTHARRYFVDAEKIAPGEPDATYMIGEIAKLYAIEKKAREEGMNHDERLHLRQREALPQLARIKESLIQTRKRVLPKSKIAQACDYALGQWARLEVYAQYGDMEIDNNYCEGAIRPIAVGRKNWLHVGSEEAGPAIAAIMSVLETCKRLRINAREYLLDVLPRVPAWNSGKIAELTPMAWAAARKSGPKQS